MSYETALLIFAGLVGVHGAVVMISAVRPDWIRRIFLRTKNREGIDALIARWHRDLMEPWRCPQLSAVAEVLALTGDLESGGLTKGVARSRAKARSYRVAG